MSTLFSVNLNKLALIRNSRGTDYPNLIDFTQRLIKLGVKGFTVHPRPDERHIRYQDVYDLKALLSNHEDIELNVEGNPNNKFLSLIKEVKPHQCTFVPDSVDQLTSDHGYDIIQHKDFLSETSREFQDIGTRCAVFVDPDLEQIQATANSDIKAIEIYTESWARAYEANSIAHVDNNFRQSIALGNQLGLRVNAGHDLNLDNLTAFLALGEVAEVSIGHAFTVESIEQGMDNVVAQYLKICS